MIKRCFRTRIEDITLVYRVTRHKNAYSVTVTERVGNERTSYTLQEVTDNEREAEAIARFFCENTVSPVHAYDILQEQFCCPDLTK